MIETNAEECRLQEVSEWTIDGGTFKRQAGPLSGSTGVHKNPAQTKFDRVIEKRTRGQEKGGNNGEMLI